MKSLALFVSVHASLAAASHPRLIFGPDVSHYQDVVNWTDVKRAGASFAFAKASEGVHTGDEQFAKNWEGMRAAGIEVRGAYHFGHPELDPEVQAKHFLSQIPTPIQSGDLLVLDIEANSKGMPASSVAKWCMAWLSAVLTATGLPSTRVLVYTGAWFWDPQCGGSAAAARNGHKLWVSGYVDESRLRIPSGWSTWTFWQYTDRASDCGPVADVDCSVFNGSMAELRSLAGVGP